LVYVAPELYWMSFGAANQVLSIPHSLEIVVQDDGSVGSRRSAATSDSCTRGVLDSRPSFASDSAQASDFAKATSDKPTDKKASPRQVKAFGNDNM